MVLKIDSAFLSCGNRAWGAPTGSDRTLPESRTLAGSLNDLTPLKRNVKDSIFNFSYWIIHIPTTDNRSPSLAREGESGGELRIGPARCRRSQLYPPVPLSLAEEKGGTGIQSPGIRRVRRLTDFHALKSVVMRPRPRYRVAIFARWRTGSPEYLWN